MDLPQLEMRLQAFAERELGRTVSVEGVHGFSGSHGGLTYGFRWKVPGASAERFVIRLAPTGVRRSGNTDVLRQVPLLTTLREHGFPVPPICFYGGEEDGAFGTDYVVFRHVPGRAFVVWHPDVSFSRAPDAVAPLWEHAVDLLARVHAFDWEPHLGTWEAVTPIESEVERWDPILAQAAEPEWQRHGERVRERLTALAPPASPIGLLHGDCQPSNVLFLEDGRVSALLDWELSSIGSQYYDLGWLAMIGDRKSWHEAWQPVTPLEPEALIERYRDRTGRDCAGIAWYRALANYKMAVVTGLYVKLHRTGRRTDPAWEQFGRAVPHLFAGAERLLA